MDALQESAALRLPISSPLRMHAFDCTRPHETAQYKGQVESRVSIIFFQNRRGWNAPEPVSDGLRELGFVPASSQADADRFAYSFELCSDGRGFASWPVGSAGRD